MMNEMDVMTVIREELLRTKKIESLILRPDPFDRGCEIDITVPGGNKLAMKVPLFYDAKEAREFYDNLVLLIDDLNDRRKPRPGAASLRKNMRLGPQRLIPA